MSPANDAPVIAYTQRPSVYHARPLVPHDRLLDAMRSALGHRDATVKRLPVKGHAQDYGDVEIVCLPREADLLRKLVGTAFDYLFCHKTETT